jgi:superkiller protein 3
LAWSLSQLSRHHEALIHYRELVRRFPDNADLHLGLAESLLRLNHAREAVEACRDAAERAPNNPLIHAYLATSHIAAGELQDACVAYRRILSLRPDDLDALSNLGATLGQLKHWKDAAEYSARALAIRPKAESAYNLGVALAELGRHEEAAQAFRTSLSLEPDSKETKIRLALTLKETGHTDAAIRLLDEVTEARTSHEIGLSMLAGLLVEIGKTEEGLETGRRAVQLGPHDPATHAALGWASLKASLTEAALRSFGEALRLDPENVDYEAGLGAVYSSLGEHRSAMAWFDRVLAKDSDYFEETPALRDYFEATRSVLARDSVPDKR